MFQVLQPIWLLAIAGISVPVLIHLWNVKQGKTLKIGSISLLRQSSKQKARSWKVTDLLQLIIRCLIILLAAVLLAQPVWYKKVGQAKKAGWILIEQQNLVQTYNRFKPKIDSLLRSGYELHYFNPGFAKVERPEEALKAQADTIAPSSLSYWSLLTELDQELQTDQKIYLFTPNRLNRFAGARPSISLQLEWNTYSVNEGASAWLTGARLIDPERIRISKASSDTGATLYNSEIVPASGNTEFATTFKNGQLLVFPRGSSQGTIVDTATRRITVYTDRFGTDADYLLAALEAIREFTGEKFRISYVTDASRIAKNEDWLFWMSTRKVPAGLQARNRFIYQNGKLAAIHGRISTSADIAAGAEPMGVYKRIAADPARKGEPLWRDGFGDPLLTRDRRPESTDFYFYGRINPSWSDLPWSADFPEQIFQLLYEENQSIHPRDARKAVQILPRISPKNTVIKKTETAEFPLSRIFWLILFFLFLLERGISFYSERRVSGIT